MELLHPPTITWEGHTVKAKDGRLWIGDEEIGLPLADKIAWAHGFNCAEQVVRSLSKHLETLEKS